MVSGLFIRKISLKEDNIFQKIPINTFVFREQPRPPVIYFKFSIDQVIIKKFIGSSKENILRINKM